MTAEIGVVVTNRNRPEPLRNCLVSLAVQSSPPAWVAIADLGSCEPAATQLEILAENFGVSCLHIAHDGPWNQALAFNTAFLYMPPVSHVIQLDADMMLHPYLLAFTERGLHTVEALCCVPSYVSSAQVPKNYGGKWDEFRQLLSLAYGGNKLSRGGYVCLPHTWLIENRGYDETYNGWGFEDADLWWRAEQQLTTYVEESGSLLLHQSHARQAGATLGEANPNLRRYRLREAGVSLPVNPGGFGQAPVQAAEVRLGIRASSGQVLSEAMAGFGLRGVRLRSRQRGRLRPTPNPIAQLRSSGGSAMLDELMASPNLSHASAHCPDKVSVIMLLNRIARGPLAASLRALEEQSIAPNQIILTDCGEFSELTDKYLSNAHLPEGKWDYISDNGPGTPPGKAVQGALRHVDKNSSYLLVMSESLLLHPRMLELLLSLQVRGSSFIYGRTHAVPAMASEISDVAAVPWEAWGSVAHLEARDFGWWHFGPKSWIEQNAVYDQQAGAEAFQQETLRRVGYLGTLSLIQLPDDLVLCYSCPKRVDIQEEGLLNQH